MSVTHRYFSCRVETMATNVGDSRVSPLTVEVTTKEQVTVLSAVGAIDLATVETLEAAIEKVIESETGPIVVDLTGVDFLASAGIALLVATHQRIDADRGLAVIADGPVTARPLMLTGLDEVLHIHTTVDDAVAAY